MFVYNKFVHLLSNGGLDFDAAGTVLRVLLERSTSTYAPNRDHDFVGDLAGLVEISVTSYARQTLGGKAANLDDVNDRVELDINDIAFGNLESGQTVKALIFYQQVGGDDVTPADDPLAIYYDGKIDVTLAANAASGATTIYIDPLPAAIPFGATLDFGGGATTTLSEQGDIGERELTCSALGAAATAGAVSAGVSVLNNILPHVLGGGAFTVVVDSEGLVHLKTKYP